METLLDADFETIKNAKQTLETINNRIEALSKEINQLDGWDIATVKGLRLDKIKEKSLLAAVRKSLLGDNVLLNIF